MKLGINLTKGVAIVDEDGRRSAMKSICVRRWEMFWHHLRGIDGRSHFQTY